MHPSRPPSRSITVSISYGSTAVQSSIAAEMNSRPSSSTWYSSTATILPPGGRRDGPDCEVSQPFAHDRSVHAVQSIVELEKVRTSELESVLVGLVFRAFREIQIWRPRV